MGNNTENFEVTNPLSMLFRKAVPIKAGEVIEEGQWFEIDSNGEAVLSGASAPTIAYLAFIESERPDVKGTLPNGSEVSLGGMTGILGVLEGHCNNTCYDDTKVYNQGDRLTVKSGKLTPAASGESVYAYVQKPLGADGVLYVTGASGVSLGVAP